MKLIFFISAILIYLNTSVAFGQEVVYIEVFEHSRNNYPSKMIIVTPDDQIQIVPLNLANYYLKDGETGKAPIIKKELENWILKGFEIKTSNFSTIVNAADNVCNYTVYVLVKN